MLLGISGYIGAGKDTLGLMIQYQLYLRQQVFGYTTALITWEEFQSQHHIMHALNSLSDTKKFAFALKEIMSILTGATMQQLEDNDFKNSDLPSCWDRTAKDAFDWLKLRAGSSPVAYIPIHEDEIKLLATHSGFKWTRTYREMLQELGTEVFRDHFHPQVWVNALMRRYVPLEDINQSHYLGESINAGLVQRKQY